MKKNFVLIAFIIYPLVISAQYWQERTTEHNFEKSELFFQSHYLNPYGIEHLKVISVGFIEDPFLNIQLNPAVMPKLKNGSTEIYIDFRGDRTESALVSNYVTPYYYDMLSSHRSVYRPDYRQISETRSESEPIVSFGFITYPLDLLKNEFYVGGTFQYLHAKDNFYSPNFGIYSNNFYADGYNTRVSESSSIPTIVRYAGKDEMIQRAILVSAFTGYKIAEDFSLGLNFNSVTFDRSGDYLNENNDEYGNIGDNENNTKNLKSRNQDYNHYDFALGLAYNKPNNLIFGIKAGLLRGNVDQNNISQSRYLYRNNEPEVSDEWYYHLSDYKNDQSWQQEGNTKYFTVNFSRAVKKVIIKLFYKYSSTEIDAKTSSSLIDTSYSSNRNYSTYNSSYSTSKYNSLIRDIRNGNGNRDSEKHEFMFNINWSLSEKTKIYTGFYLNLTNSTITNTEFSLYNYRTKYQRTGSYESNNNYTLFEDKKLTWAYDNRHISFQIPIIFDFLINKNFEIMLGISRVFHDWSISSNTSVYFTKRIKEENGIGKEENFFIERYIKPNENYTDDYTDVFTKFKVNISKELNVNLLVNPEFDDTFRIAQWWLSFRANL